MDKYTIIGMDSNQKLCVRWVTCTLRTLCEQHLDMSRYKQGSVLIFAGHIDPPEMVVPVGLADAVAERELIARFGG